VAKRNSKLPLPAVGDAFAVPLSNGMWGGCRVIRVGDPGQLGKADPRSVQVGALAWTGTEPPTGNEPDIERLLFLDHHAQWGLAIVWVSGHYGPMPSTWVPIATVPPLAEDLSRSVNSWAAWDYISIQIECQWRWHHDREAVLAEDEVKRKRLEASDAERMDARRRKLATLTLRQIRNERPFTHWRRLWPGIVVTESRRTFRETVDQLVALGPHPTLDAAIPILKACVERFNELDAAHDNFIETEEREDICEHFARMVHAAGLAEYGSGDLTDQWRDW
jgi:hypothetical protein